MSEEDLKQPILQLKGVRKVFDYDLLKQKEVALDGVDLNFLEKQCSGLLGHNGAGKTTAIRVIFGLIRPDQGKVLYRGQPLKRDDLRHFGYMPEINKLAANLTPFESLWHQLNVYQGLTLKKGERKAAVEATIQKVGLTRHQNKRIGKLSKGLQRRLAWAMATIHQPNVLILDEPFSGLDPLGRNQLSSWIEEERFRGASIVLCTHELSTAKKHCQELLILKRGKKVYDSAAGQADRQNQNTPYELLISGVQISQLNELQETNNLPNWESATQKEFLCHLVFSNYLEANQWLQVSTAQGFLITRFCEASRLASDDILLPYFDPNEGN